jgi:hypothetical protein
VKSELSFQYLGPLTSTEGTSPAVLNAQPILSFDMYKRFHLLHENFEFEEPRLFSGLEGESEGRFVAAASGSQKMRRREQHKNIKDKSSNCLSYCHQ